MASKAKLLKEAVWIDTSDLGQGGTVSFLNMMKLRIPDPETWIKWKADPGKNVPHCILQYLRKTDGDEMELRCPEERYVLGESVIVEDIAKDGARMLITKKMQSELAFAVTRIDVVAFQQTDFILQGQPYEYTQYCCDLPENYMANMLYHFVPQMPLGNDRSIGDMVSYSPKLKEATLFTAKVCRATQQARSPFISITVQCLAGEISIFSGKGFQTTNTLGVVMEMTDTGVITKWRELWNQDYFARTYPQVLKSLRPFFVFETDKERTDHVHPDHIRRVFDVMPAALALPQDMYGHGAVFIVGVVSNAGRMGIPIGLNGVRALGGEELLKLLYDYVMLIQKETLESYISQLMCAIDDGLHAAEDYKAESSKSLSPIEIRMSGQICLALLYKLTQPNQRKVEYESNTLMVEYGNWAGLAPIMGRNARETTLSDGCIFIAGQPKFKWMMLPYSRLVLSLKDFQLLSRGRSVAHLDSTGARRLEYNSKLKDGKYCKICLRKKKCACP